VTYSAGLRRHRDSFCRRTSGGVIAKIEIDVRMSITAAQMSSKATPREMTIHDLDLATIHVDLVDCIENHEIAPYCARPIGDYKYQVCEGVTIMSYRKTVRQICGAEYPIITTVATPPGETIELISVGITEPTRASIESSAALVYSHQFCGSSWLRHFRAPPRDAVDNHGKFVVGDRVPHYSSDKARAVFSTTRDHWIFDSCRQ
jgi:hypothetical protein